MELFIRPRSRVRLIGGLVMALVLAVSGPYLVNQLGTAFNGGAAAMQRSFPRHSAVPAGCPGGPDGPPVPGSCTPANASLVAVVEPQAGFGPLYQAISAARSTVDLTIYELVDPTAETDLAADAGRGVTVRVILDHNLERAHNTTAYRYLTAHGVHVVWAAPRYAATHQKTLTVDHTTSIVMTANLTAADYPTTRDFLVTDTDPADVASIESTFDADFTGTTLTPATGAGLVWSPTNSQNSILAMIDGATRTLAVENEEMGLPAVTNALAAAARRGVNVTVTMTASPHWARPFAQLAAAGVHVATYPNTSTALYIHAKVIVADAGTAAARAFVGSENFSTASLTRNRELGITTPTPAVVDAVSATLTADYHGAQAN